MNFMTGALKFTLRFALLVGAVYLYMQYSIWNDSNKENGVIQLLPYELFTTSNSYEIEIYHLSNPGDPLEKCGSQSISSMAFEYLRNVESKNNDHRYVITNTYKTKLPETLKCDIAVGDWDKFLKIEQPTYQQAKLVNAKKRSEHAE
jgi:hypothetical protein